MVYKFKTNINCANCVKSVSRSLNSLDGLKNWDVDTNSPDKILSAELENIDKNILIEAVKSSGFEIEAL